MHYTSPENIHKVIDPLFLDDYRAQFQDAMQEKQTKKRIEKLRNLQEELGRGRYFDPACGSGNFLTESFLSLRRLENDILRELQKESDLGLLNLNFVTIDQFYGIEINDFAVAVCKTALWIAEAQMFAETEEITGRQMDFLPLHTNSNIHEGNALRMDWREVVTPSDNVKIMGNPPFVGKKEQSKEQKQDLLETFQEKRGVGNLDYVCAWYKKAADYIGDTKIKGAFVSTNSISQGEQASALWKRLVGQIQPIFAYQTFVWSNEADSKHKAHVHCVIIGFCSKSETPRTKEIYINGVAHHVKNISAYLTDAPMILVESRTSSISHGPKMMYGSMPIDNGIFTLSEDDVKALLSESETNKKFIREYIGGDELLHNTHKYCLWLKGCSPKEMQSSKFIMKRVEDVRAFRSSRQRPQTKKLADVPYLFGEIRQPDTDMLVFPKVSSEKRRYIPIGFVHPSIIVSGSALIIPNATMYEFGVLMSNVHNAWMRAVAGRMKSDYQYSKDIVYNTFPWANPTQAQKDKIAKTAQDILDARALYPDNSLANLYNETFMPKELRDAHRKNDRAVMEAYGFWGRLNTESDCVAELMKMYQSLVEESEKQKR